MHRWQLAARRYEQIVPRPIVRSTEFPLREIETWIRHDVCPVVDEFSRRATFREYATWPMRCLRPQAPTPERKLVDRLQGTIRLYALALLKQAGSARFRSRLNDEFPPSPSLNDESVEISALSRATPPRAFRPESVVMELLQVERFVKESEEPLVRPEDYFEPVQDVSRAPGMRPVQRGELIVAFTPELDAIGHFVVRALFRRLDVRLRILGSLRGKCQAVLTSLGNRAAEAWKKSEALWADLEEQNRALRVALETGPDVILRDSCIVLTQVYAAFHPSPDLSWTGLPAVTVERGASVLQLRLGGSKAARIAERIAAALPDLDRIYAEQPTDQSAREEAIASGGLVIDSRDRSVHWETQLVPGPWHKVSWDFLFALARKGRHKADVHQEDLYDDVKSSSAMSTNARRLRALLPPTLKKLIVSGRKPQTYRLELESHRIHLFDERPEKAV